MKRACRQQVADSRMQTEALSKVPHTCRAATVLASKRTSARTARTTGGQAPDSRPSRHRRRQQQLCIHSSRCRPARGTGCTLRRAAAAPQRIWPGPLAAPSLRVARLWHPLLKLDSVPQNPWRAAANLDLKLGRAAGEWRCDSQQHEREASPEADASSVQKPRMIAVF